VEKELLLYLKAHGGYGRKLKAFLCFPIRKLFEFFGREKERWIEIYMIKNSKIQQVI
jgi:hypothetical protein